MQLSFHLEGVHIFIGSYFLGNLVTELLQRKVLVVDWSQFPKILFGMQFQQTILDVFL
jgi:hypothetical protein